METLRTLDDVIEDLENVLETSIETRSAVVRTLDELKAWRASR